jgi:hypothetical protein
MAKTKQSRKANKPAPPEIAEAKRKAREMAELQAKARQAAGLPDAADKKLAASRQVEVDVRSKRRRGIALEATYQIASLFDALAERGRALDHPDTIGDSTVIKALAFRGAALTNAAIAALGDETPAASSSTAIEDLERMVTHG